MTEFAAQFQDYLIHTKNASENTVASYMRDIRQFIAYLSEISAPKLSDVRHSQICDYVSWMQNAGKSRDQERYQTVYSKIVGSAAAPTAGLHFTNELLEQIRAIGVDIVEITLHVGLGTFRPVKAEEITEHHMHAELCMIDASAARRLNETRARGGRIICVGTTSCRTLESLVQPDGSFCESSAWTDIFIYPGYQFRAMDALITNFHSLIFLHKGFHGRVFAEGEKLALHVVVVLEPVVAPGRVQYPVADENHIQEPSEFFCAQLDRHFGSLLCSMRREIRSIIMHPSRKIHNNSSSTGKMTCFCGANRI